jgi:predicted nucleic acid-binding protein
MELEAGPVAPPSVAPLLKSLRVSTVHNEIAGADESGVFPWSLFPPAGVVVVDANALRSDVLYGCRKAHRTTLVSAANEGLLRLYAAAHVVQEVAEHYQRWCSDGEVSSEVFWQRWQTEYLPLLRIVDVPSGLLTAVETQRVQRLEAVDPDDVPSVTLTLLLGGFFLSEDARACRAVYGESGSAEQRRQWLGVLQAGGDAGQLRSLLHGGVLVGRGLWELLRVLAARPWLLVPAAAFAATAAARWTPERTARLRAVAGDVVEGLGAIATAQTEAARRFQRACVPLPDWDAVADELPARAVLTRALLVQLARAPGGPCSAAELAASLPVLPVAQGDAMVRAVLRTERCFTLVAAGRWQLGTSD